MSQDIVNENQSLSYTNLDFSSIYTEVLDMTKQLTRDWDPSISDESDPGIVLVKLSALLADKCNYNIDKSILEAFPLSVTQESNARQLYEQLGYYMHWHRAASVAVSIRYKQNDIDDSKTYTIPKFTTVTDDNQQCTYTLIGTEGDSGVVVSDGTLYLNQNETLRMIAYEGIPTYYESEGKTIITPAAIDKETNRIYLKSSYVFENGVFINNVKQDNFAEWSRVDNLYEYSYNVHRYKFGYDSNSNVCYIEFPDNYAELIGEGIEITYLCFDGENGTSSGNITADYLSKFLTTVSIPVEDSNEEIILNKDLVQISNTSAAIGHMEKEGLNDAYKNYKHTVGTFNTLITLRDYMNYVRSADLGICSNAIVTDRTNDIQSTYKIVTKAHDVESIITQIEKDNELIRFTKTTDEDVYSNKSYYVKNTSGEFTKVTNPVVADLSKYYEAIGEDKLSPFSLKFYLLRTGISDVRLGTEYNNTFELTSNIIDMDSVLEESSHLVHNFEDIESLPENFEDAPLTKIIFIRNKYPISMNITTYSSVSYEDRLNIRKNIILAFYENLDSSNVEFGTAVSIDYLTKIALESDSRIKKISFDNATSSTYAVYYNPDTRQYEEIDLPNSLTELTDSLSASTDGLTEEEKFELTLSRAMGKEIVCRSILKGTTRLLIPDDAFDYHLNQKFMEYRDEVKYLTGEATIDMNKTDSSQTYKVVDGDDTKTTNSYTLQDNEMLTLFRPQLEDLQEFTSGVHYDYCIFSDISANQSYELKLGEQFVFYTSNMDSAGKLESFTVYVYNVGSIISPTFDIPARDRENLPDVIRTKKELEDTEDDNSYTYTETSTSLVNRINANAGISNTKIATNESINVQKVNKFTVTPSDGYRFLWVLNKPTYINNKKSYVLFDGYNSKEDTDLENATAINKYTLRTGEVICYTNPETSELAVLGAGTTVYRECGTDNASYDALEDTVTHNGQFVFVKWSDVKESTYSYLGSGLTTCTPKEGGLYELNSANQFVRSVDTDFSADKDYYIILMKDTSGWYLSREDSSTGAVSYYPAATPTTSVFRAVDLINDYATEYGTIEEINPYKKGLFERVVINNEEITDVYRLASKKCNSTDNTYTQSDDNRKVTIGKYKRYTNTLDDSALTDSFMTADNGIQIKTTDPASFSTITLKSDGEYSPYNNKYVTRNDEGTLQVATESDRLFTSVDVGYDATAGNERYFYKDNSSSPTYKYLNGIAGGIGISSSGLSTITTAYSRAKTDTDTIIDRINYIDEKVKSETNLEDHVHNFRLNKFKQLDTPRTWGDASGDLQDKFIELNRNDIENLPNDSTDFISRNIHLGFKDSLTEASDDEWVSSYYQYYKNDTSKVVQVSDSEASNYYKYDKTSDTTVNKDIKYYISQQPLVSYKPTTGGPYTINTINTDAVNKKSYTAKTVTISDLKSVIKTTGDTTADNSVYVRRSYKKTTVFDYENTDKNYFVLKDGTSFITISAYQAQDYLDHNTMTVYESDETYTIISKNTDPAYMLEYDESKHLALYTYDSAVNYEIITATNLATYDTTTYTGGLYTSTYAHMPTITTAASYNILTGVQYVGDGNGTLSKVVYNVKKKAGVSEDDYGFIEADVTPPTYTYQNADSLVTGASYYDKDHNFKFYYDGAYSYVLKDGSLVKDESIIEGDYSLISSTDTDYFDVSSSGSEYTIKVTDDILYYYYEPNNTLANKSSYAIAYIDNDGKKYYKPTADADYKTLLANGSFKPFTQVVDKVIGPSGVSSDIQLSDYIIGNTLPSNSPFKAASLIKYLLLNKMGNSQTGIYEKTIYVNKAEAIFAPESKNSSTSPYIFNVYTMYGENTYLNDGKESTISGEYATLYTANVDGVLDKTSVNVARDYCIAEGKSVAVQNNKVTCTVGAFVEVDRSSGEFVKEGVDYYVIPESDKAKCIKEDTNGKLEWAKITCKPTKFQVGTLIVSGSGSGGEYIFKRRCPRDSFYYQKQTFKASTFDAAIQQFLSAKNPGDSKLTNNFQVNKRYYLADSNEKPIAGTATDYNKLSPVTNLCKREEFDITSKEYQILVASGSVNPANLGYYVRVNISPAEWNSLHTSKYDKLYEKHSGIGCFVPLTSQLMTYTISRYSNSENNTFLPFTYERYTDVNGGIGTAVGDKVYLPLSYTTFDTEFTIIGETEERAAYEDVSDLLFTTGDDGKLQLTNVQAKIGNAVQDLFTSEKLFYSYFINLEDLLSWVNALNTYLLSYTTSVYFMPLWYELGEWLKFVDKTYYAPQQYYHKNVDSIDPFVCYDFGGSDGITKNGNDLLKGTEFAKVQSNTSLTFTRNEMTVLSKGDVFTISTNDRYGEERELPIFTNDTIQLDLDAYEMAYQRTGDSYVNIDKITIDDCAWEAYSNLKINSSGSNGQKLLSNHTLIAYTLNDNKEPVQLGNIIQCTEGNENIHFQLQNSISTSVGTFIDVSQIDDLKSGQETLNKLYVYNVAEDGDRYAHTSEFATNLYFKKTIDTKSVSQIVVGVPTPSNDLDYTKVQEFTGDIGLASGNYLFPINGLSDAKLTLTYYYTAEGNASKRNSAGIIDPSVAQNPNFKYKGSIQLKSYIEPEKTYFFGNKLHFGSLTIEDSFDIKDIKSLNISLIDANTSGYTHINDCKILNGYIVATIDKSYDEDVVTVVINDIFKFEPNSQLGNSFDDIKEKIIQLDVDSKFNYTHEVQGDDLIEDPLIAKNYWDKNHPLNEFTIAQLDVDQIDYVFNKTI